jgi:hypothetical protein
MATPIGDTTIEFGIPSEEGGFSATTSVQVTRKREKKEAKNRQGEVVTVVFMNPMAEITIEGYGLPSGATLGGTVTTTTFDFNGTAYIEEITSTATNEDFVKTTIKAVAYENI